MVLNGPHLVVVQHWQRAVKVVGKETEEGGGHDAGEGAHMHKETSRSRCTHTCTLEIIADCAAWHEQDQAQGTRVAWGDRKKALKRGLILTSDMTMV